MSQRIKDIIRDALDEYDISARRIPYEYQPFRTPHDAQRSRRYLEVRGFAWFSCPQKHHRWASANAWCFIDLKKQAICYSYKQSCKKCESKVKPVFLDDSVEKMADIVAVRYLKMIGKWDDSYDDSDEGSDYDEEPRRAGPHDEERCGKCQRLGYRCCD